MVRREQSRERCSAIWNLLGVKLCMKCRVKGSLKGAKDLIDLIERWAYLQNVIG
jgi:hypothetical protein